MFTFLREIPGKDTQWAPWSTKSQEKTPVNVPRHAGIGNAGQTNYGYANSVLDEVVKRRAAAADVALGWGIGWCGCCSFCRQFGAGL